LQSGVPDSSPIKKAVDAENGMLAGFRLAETMSRGGTALRICNNSAPGKAGPREGAIAILMQLRKWLDRYGASAPDAVAWA
jgi:hypothetical protein